MLKKSELYDLLEAVQKPTRYLGNELNSIIKEWSKVKTRIALCFPDTYEIGMSHLGMRILYHYLNNNVQWLAERFYMPWTDMRDTLREKKIPLFSLENKRSLSEFDILGFSLQYELEYTNLLDMLDLGNIPVLQKERSEEDPIVIAGGPVVFNPEPMARFLDAFLIGDGEEAFALVIEKIVDCRSRGLKREDILVELSRIDGVYVPSLYKTAVDPASGFTYVSGVKNEIVPFPVPRAVLEDINQFPFPEKIIVPFGRIVHDRVAVELARGCTQGCRFCQAGIIYRPVRERSPSSVVSSILGSIKETGYDEVSLSSLSSADYSGIELLAEHLMDLMEQRSTALSISSLRVYGVTEKLAKQIARVKKTGFTIAPEAGSQRLRDVVNKGISERDILNGAGNAFRNGWQLIKLYLMIGLPTETEEDVIDIAKLTKNILKIGRDAIGNRARVNVSINTFIPKPHTPFQWSGLEPEESIRNKQRLLLNAIKSEKAIKLSFNDYRLSVIETMMSRGDRKTGELIEKVWRKGAVLDAWDEHIKYDLWAETIEEVGLDRQQYLGARSDQTIFPWDHVDTLVTKDFLASEFKQALAEKVTLPCEQPVFKNADERVDRIKEEAKYVCYSCGMDCNLPAISSERKDNIIRLEKAMEEHQFSPKSDSEGDEIPIVYHYVVSYEKTGDMRFLSQLDFQKLLIHAFRKTEIPIAISLGFNPKPRLWFPISLGVGIAGRNEKLGFSTLELIDTEEVKEKINGVLPTDLLFHSIEQVDAKDLKEHKAVSALCYRLVPRNITPDDETVNRNIETVMQSGEIVMERIVKKKKRMVNIRPFIVDASYDTESKNLDVTCHLLGVAGVRPEHLSQIFFGLPLAEVAVERLWVK